MIKGWRRSRRTAAGNGAGRGERGASVIEFALLSTIMFMMLFGILSYGEVLADYVQLRHRLGEISRLVSLGEDAADRQSIYVEAKNEVMAGFMGHSGCRPSFSPDTLPASGSIVITATYSYGANGECRIMPQIPLVPLPASLKATNAFSVAD
ncbi:MAG: pilus assembly protein [Zavarzinia sp.]|nr:pilus assembly protein [Zavarzinia sp.]